ncbi:MAG: DUF2809 domain-containing protein [Flavobacteriaceae bacterium]|jgi:hypothetical protein|nr:DUF2809 domain-containing protein [Flavobacteriaceae bacterium]
MKFRFSIKYFATTALLFLIEVLIATKLNHVFFVRAFLGDVFVVMLIYVFLLSFFEIKNKNVLILGIFAFACLIEFSQYFKIAEKLGFEKGSIMYIVLGNSFSWMDILCYATGCLLVFMEKINLQKKLIFQ